MEDFAIKKARDKYLEFHGVRITPKTLILKNAYEGKFFREKILFQNVAYKPVILWTRNPSSFSFNLENCLHGVTLSCGLTVSVWINFTYSHKCVMQAQLPICVNDHYMSYDIQVYVSSGHIFSIPRFIDFGTVNAGYSVHLKTVTLHNNGYQQTKFAFDLADNELDLIVKPLKGFIPARGATVVEIDFIGFKEGRFVKEVWIKCDHPFRISVAVDVITPKLYVIEPTDYTESFTPVMFPPIYGACKCTESIVILNYNTLKALYIIVPEHNYETMSIQKARLIEPMHDSFHLSPIDGYLEPNEKREIKISFEPKHIVSSCEKVFFVFYRIIRLESMNVDKMLSTPHKLKAEYSSSLSDDSIAHVQPFLTEEPNKRGEVEPSMLIRRTSRNPLDTSFPSFIRVCLYGVIRPVEVDIHPKFINLGSMLMNTKAERTLVLHNRSTALPIYFQYKKVAFIDTLPSNGYIPCRESIQISVTIAPKSGGTIQNTMSFELLYLNLPVVQEKEFVVVGKVDVQVDVNVIIEGSQLKPKFNPGIVPKITNEIGLLTDTVRFCTDVEKPRMAMLGYQKQDDALIAFPNDRPRSLRPWREKNVKTIFAAIPRLVTENDEYSLTPDELMKKQHNTSYYSMYIDSLRKERLEHRVYGKAQLADYEVNELKLLGKTGTKARTTTVAEYPTPIRNEFPLLTPIQIFFVKIKPTVLNIGKVLVSSKSSYKIFVKNENIFRVKLLLSAHDLGEKSAFPNLPQQHIIDANTNMGIDIDFEPAQNGRFNAILNVYLNKLHVHPILFQADVMLPSISVESRSIEFDDINRCRMKPVNLYNTLNEAVHFAWSVPSMCCFSMEPMSGTVPQNRYVTCQLFYTPDLVKRVSGKLSVKCDDGNPTYLDVTACLERANVTFTQSKINVPHIPLNITTRVINTLRNFEDHAVLFTIRNPKPLPGVFVKPISGKIKGRSDMDLTVTLHFKAFIRFECTVEVQFQHGKDVSFKICGSVDFPHIHFKPNDVQMKRICAESFDIVPFTIENNGHSEIEVTFVEDLFPELRVSNSMDINSECYRSMDLKLQPGEGTPLFLHFFPLDVCMNTCYLPVVINGILGPALAEDKKTLQHATYLEKYAGEYDHEHIEFLKLKHKIHFLSVTTITARHVLRFSKTFFKFKYHSNVNYRSFTSYEFKIKNESKSPVHFTINVKEARPHFAISDKFRDSQDTEEDVMRLTLDTEEEITLYVSFIPGDAGKFSVNLPVYLKDHNDGAVFNYLQLRANYHNASFTGPSFVHLTPVPVYVVASQDFHLAASYHLANCTIQISSDVDQLKVTVPDARTSVADVYLYKTLKVKLRFSSYTEMSFTTKLYVNCSCGGECNVFVTGCADNSAITSYAYNYMSLNAVPDAHTFPHFPLDTNRSEFAKYMRGVQKTTEMWLFSQVLYKNFRHFIPSSLSEIYRHGTSDIGGKKVLVLVRILVNIGGPGVLPFLINRDIPHDELERINYYHATYLNALAFLKTRKASIPHVRARYLLSYPDYLIYMAKIREEKKKSVQSPVDQVEFRQLATRSWLDLLLQIFKTMVLSSIRNLSQISRFQVVSQPDSDCESVLLSWCTVIFNRQRETLMDLDPKRPEKFTLASRTITDFTADFSDGLVLIAITLDHCPYLTHNLKNIYVQVDSTVKAFHNAALLQSAWSLIKASWHFTPNDIVHPCPVHMVMLLTYMYNTFPNLVPKEDIAFRVNLSSHEQREVIIKNPNAVDMFYEVQFLNNDTNCFSIRAEGVLKIKAGQSAPFKIRYQARKMHPIKGIILFAGDTPRETYSKSIVYSLTGEPDFSKEFICFNFRMNLYSMLDKQAIIATPYPIAATYDVWYTYTKPVTIVGTKMYHWKENASIICPRVLQTKCTKFKCDENGVGTIVVKIFCLSATIQDIWIFFSNKEVGDFFLKISIQPTRSTKQDILLLPLNLPKHWASSKCICKVNKTINPAKCPRRLNIHIPSRNDPFWSIVSKSLLYSVPIEERLVWTKFIDSQMGPYLIKWLVTDESTSISDHMFDTDIKYNILNPCAGIQMPAQVTIANIRSPLPIDTWMHVRDDLQKSRKFVEFSLESELGSEIRTYRISIGKKIRKSVQIKA